MDALNYIGKLHILRGRQGEGWQVAMRGYTSPSPRPAFSRNPNPMGPETVTRETWGSSHK